MGQNFKKLPVEISPDSNRKTVTLNNVVGCPARQLRPVDICLLQEDVRVISNDSEPSAVVVKGSVYQYFVDAMPESQVQNFKPTLFLQVTEQKRIFSRHNFALRLL
jgi:hypothetical protein